ncbi:MAG: carboxypeptidase-like regulatory domain-containing protein [Candidatus Sumerlaeia bacterium]|nr:carboxypeptidase-like regulatory domain-containing protein [Candidatus Sumerlaeia bacterium]
MTTRHHTNTHRSCDCKRSLTGLLIAILWIAAPAPLLAQEGPPVLAYESYILDDGNMAGSIGDGDGFVEQGETVQIWVRLTNVGGVAATGVNGVFAVVSGTSVTLTNTKLTWLNLAIGQTRTSQNAMRLIVAPDCAIGTTVVIRGIVDENDPTTGPWQFDLPPIQVSRRSAIRGTVRDRSTSMPIVGAQVVLSGAVQKTTASRTAGAYQFRGLPDGQYDLTASHARFGPAIPTTVTATVPPDRNGVDIYLSAPLRRLNPTSITMVVSQGGSGERTLWVGNQGTFEMKSWLLERQLGPFTPRILVFTDDFTHGGTGTYVDRALTRLGLPYRAHYTEEFVAFENDLRTSGPWDLVIYDNAIGQLPPTTLFDALDDYVVSGGRLVIYCYSMVIFETHPLWARLGVTYQSTFAGRPDPVYWWQQDHILFHAPMDVPEFTQFSDPILITGQRVAVSPSASVVAGYQSRTPQAGMAALVLGSSGRTLFRAIGDIANNQDLDNDGIRDGEELWVNIIEYFIDRVPWMDRTPRNLYTAVGSNTAAFVTAEATTLPVGLYQANLIVTTSENTNNTTQVPVTLQVVTTATVPTAPGRPMPDIAPFSNRPTVRYTWTGATDPSGIEYYRIQVGTWPGYNDRLDANTGTSRTATATGEDGQTLRARVRAINSHYQAGPWSQNSFATLIDLSPPNTPATPTDRGEFTSQTTVRFNWTAATDFGTSGSGIQSYDLQVGTGPGMNNVFNGNVGNVLGRNVNGANQQILFARIRARDRAGNISGWSPASDGILVDTAAPLQPARPTDPGVMTSQTTIRFNWTAATDPGTTASGIASYDLAVGTAPGRSDVFLGNVGNNLTTDVVGANAQRLYARVRARDRAGNVGPWSQDSDGILIDTAPPGAPGTPTDIGLYTSSTQVRFNWTAATDTGTTSSGVASYDLQVGTGPGRNNVFDGNVGNVLTYQATGSNGRRLFARVRARDAVGNVGPWSQNSDGILIDTTPPNAPPGFVQDQGQWTSSTTVRFFWTAATDVGTSGSGIASYELGVGSHWSGPNLSVRNVGNVLSATYTGTDGQTLYGWARAKDRAGNVSAWSGNSDGITIDLQRPRLTRAAARDQWAVYAYFDEPVSGADRAANYSINGGVRVLHVQTVNSMLYLLHTSTQDSQTTYTLTITGGVRDRAGNLVNPSFNKAQFRGGMKTDVRSWEAYK